MYPPDHETISSSILSHDMSTADTMSLTWTTIATTASSAFDLAAALSTMTASAMATATGAPKDGSENTGECQLLGPFALLVQAALGGLALLSLVYKRWRERPQRPVKVWAFDVSKQVFGTMLLHLANLFMSMFSAGEIQATIAKAAASTVGADTLEEYQPNPCSFYLLNLAIDTTIGIPILILILRVLTVGASYTPIAKPSESIISGNYGDPPKATWWLKQSFIYFLGLLGMKACVFLIFQLCPWIIEVGDWALRWTEGNEAVQIAFVMFIFPLIMNAMQYYIIDSIIKKKQPAEPEQDSADGEGDDGEHGGLLAEDDHDQGRSVDEDETCKSNSITGTKTKPKGRRIKSYDPDKDGEISPPNGESSSVATSQLDEENAKQKPAEI